MVNVKYSLKSQINLIIILFIFVTLVLGCVAPNEKTSVSNISESSAPPLKLLSSRSERSSNSYVTIEGEVQNISGSKLETVWVVINHYDKSGQLVTSEDSVIDFTPLMPNQISPFKSMARYNPLMDNYKISFRETFGAEIKYIDATPTTAAPVKKKKK